MKTLARSTLASIAMLLGVPAISMSPASATITCKVQVCYTTEICFGSHCTSFETCTTSEVPCGPQAL